MTKREAIKELRGFIGQLTEGCQEAIKVLIPELKESEDEKIRKFICSIIDNLEPKDFVDVKKMNVLAWLEKQKYDRMKPVYDARESFESALEKAWNDYHNGYENVDKLEDDYVECAYAKGFREGYLFGIEKQKEQEPVEFDEYKIIKKHITEDMLSSEVNKRLTECGWYVTEQKPAEWSEEDKHRCNDAIYFLETAKKHYADTSEIELTIDWLKSLRPQPKVERSVEEEPVDLEKAAEEYADKHGFRVPYDGSNNFYDDVDVKASLEGFKAGAKWMAEQGVSYETELGWEIDGDRAFPELDPPVEDLLMPSDISLNFNDGDKVIVQIRKAE